MTDDRAYAGLIARDLQRFGKTVSLLDSDLASWSASGHQTSEGLEWMISRPIDTYFESDHFEDKLIMHREHHAYLNWETALIDHIVDEPSARFML